MSNDQLLILLNWARNQLYVEGVYIGAGRTYNFRFAMNGKYPSYQWKSCNDGDAVDWSNPTTIRKTTPTILFATIWDHIHENNT